MKLKITKAGYHDQDGEPVEVGKVITVSGDKIPAALVNKCEVLDGDTDGKEFATGQNEGPTVEEYVAAGYRAENYPPQGYEPRSTPEEIAAAIEAQKAADEARIDGLTVDELKAHLTDKGVQFPDNAKKADLVTLAKG